jgi:hypothetical protein
VTNTSDEKAVPTPHMEFFEIAAFMFVFFRVADDNHQGDPFGSFEEQLKSLPRDMPLPFKEFLQTVGRIRDVVVSQTEDGAKYRRLFNTAHLAVKDVLDALAADALWDVCKTVEFEKLKSTVLLGIGGGAPQAKATSDYPKA